MQLVLDRNGKPLTKGERAIRAYLHREDARGFRGWPVGLDGMREERELRHFYLSRFAYIETAVKRPLELYCEVDQSNGTERHVLKGMMVARKRLGSIFEYLERRKEWIRKRIEENERWPEYQRLKDSLQAFRYMDDDVFLSVQRYCQIMIDEFIKRLPDIVLFNSRNGKFEGHLRDIRHTGVSCQTFAMLLEVIEELLESGLGRFAFIHEFAFLHKPRRGEVNEEMEDAIVRDSLALKILWGVLYDEAEFQYNWVLKRKREGSTGELLRCVFSQGETNAWRYVRNRFDSLDEQIILRARRYARYRERRQGWEGTGSIEELLGLHRRYALRHTFQTNGFGLRLEASPFAEKTLDSSINFLIAVYPTDACYIRWLKRIADPSFEHADGAIASVRLTVKNGKIILEEIQSDVDTLLKMRQSEYEEKLKPLVDKWQDAAMEALRIFARTHRFEEIYAATPYRVLHRYWGGMHPDKVRLYFDGWEKMGGQLVYDDKCELDRSPQYYYRFEVPGNETLAGSLPNAHGSRLIA